MAVEASPHYTDKKNAPPSDPRISQLWLTLSTCSMSKSPHWRVSMVSLDLDLSFEFGNLGQWSSSLAPQEIRDPSRLPPWSVIRPDPAALRNSTNQSHWDSDSRTSDPLSKAFERTSRFNCFIIWQWSIWRVWAAHVFQLLSSTKCWIQVRGLSAQ